MVVALCYLCFHFRTPHSTSSIHTRLFGLFDFPTCTDSFGIRHTLLCYDNNSFALLICFSSCLCSLSPLYALSPKTLFRHPPFVLSIDHIDYNQSKCEPHIRVNMNEDIRSKTSYLSDCRRSHCELRSMSVFVLGLHMVRSVIKGLCNLHVTLVTKSAS